jgi:acetyltransferase-like isoleucine patch superfamily enzyme
MRRSKQRLLAALMQLSDRPLIGRWSVRLASALVGPYKARRVLATLTPKPYVSPGAQIICRDLRLGAHAFVDAVVIYDRGDGGGLVLGDGAHLYAGTIIELGQGGSVEIGAGSHVQPNCQFTAYLGSIRIGARVQIAPTCAFYPYQHSFAAGRPIAQQPLRSAGDIIVGDDAWLGYGVIVLDGVTIGPGAVVGAGAVVTCDVPPGAIVVGVPARQISMRPTANETD